MILRLAIFLLMMTARTGYCWDKNIKIKTVAGERCVFLQKEDFERIINAGLIDYIPSYEVEKTPDGLQIFINCTVQGARKMYFISLQTGLITQTVVPPGDDVHLGSGDSYVAWDWTRGSKYGFTFSNGEDWDNWHDPYRMIVFDPSGRYFSNQSASGVDIYSTSEPNGKSLLCISEVTLDNLFVRGGVLYAFVHPSSDSAQRWNFRLLMISIEDWKIVKTITLTDPTLDEVFDLNAKGDKVLCGLTVVKWPSMAHFNILDLNTLKITAVPMFYPDAKDAFFLPK